LFTSSQLDKIIEQAIASNIMLGLLIKSVPKTKLEQFKHYTPKIIDILSRDEQGLEILKELGIYDIISKNQ